MSDRYRRDRLTRYQNEVARGILHTERWRQLMREEEAHFNQKLIALTISNDSLDWETLDHINTEGWGSESANDES